MCSMCHPRLMGRKLDRLADQTHRVEVLRHRYRHLVTRLGRTDGATDLNRIDASVARRQNLVRHLNKRIEDLVGERDQLETEILGCLNGTEALLTGLIERYEASDGPNWSPRPVVGYTAFELRDGSLHDGDLRWLKPQLSSDNASRVLAWKSPASLPGIDGQHLVVLASLSLTGEVIEYENGYGSEQASVSAALITDGDNWFRTRDLQRLSEFWVDPLATFHRYSIAIPDHAVLFIETDIYLGESHG